MDKIEIISKLEPLIEKTDICGFEAYLVSRAEPRLKKLKMSVDNLQQNLKRDITTVIKERYLAEDATYTDADNIADNQVKFYIVEQNDEYKPFNVDTWEKEDHLLLIKNMIRKLKRKLKKSYRENRASYNHSSLHNRLAFSRN